MPPSGKTAGHSTLTSAVTPEKATEESESNRSVKELEEDVSLSGRVKPEAVSSKGEDTLGPSYTMKES